MTIGAESRSVTAGDPVSPAPTLVTLEADRDWTEPAAPTHP